VGVIKDWDSRWFVKDSEFGKTLLSDYNLRKFLKKQLFDAGVPKIEIERNNQMAKVIIHCARPGKVIGRGGSEIDKLKEEIARILGKPANEVSVSAAEIKLPDLNAQLVAEGIGQQLENRVSFRRAMKQAIVRTMKLNAKGIKVAGSGLLGGADIARTEHYHEGTIPLQTIRADIDYGQHAALTKMGLIGIKVWIYKGEVLTAVKRDAGVAEERNSRVRDSFQQQRKPRGDRRDGGGNFSRDNRDNRDNRPPRADGAGRPDNRPGGDRGGRDNNFSRPPRSDGGGGFNRGGGGRGDRGPAAPPVNFGNRKTGAARPQPPRKPVEAAAEQAPQAEGGNGDVNA